MTRNLAGDQIFQFPRGFLWGAGTSSHQVEGDNSLNDWWAWEAQGKTRDKSGKASDHYRLFREDIRLAKTFNHNAFRFSVEWSRIEPEIGVWNKEALAHYRDVIDYCLRLEIEPIVTINHFTLPVWFSNIGGWTNRDSTDYFCAFVEKVVDFLGKKVKFWVIYNEPAVYIYRSYIEGIWPPGERTFSKARTVFKNLLKACSAAHGIIHTVYSRRKWHIPMAGIAKLFLSFEPCLPNSAFDRLSVFLRNHFFNSLFIKVLADKRALDFIGLNYYKRDFIHHLGLGFNKIFGETCPESHNHAASKLNHLGWEPYPKGFGEKLVEVSRFKLPILITENGTCSINDEDRWAFIYSHIKEVAHAIKSGVNVIGYLYWSLIDNFEWAEGFGPRFGLIEVDYKTQKRIMRESGYRYASICKDSRLLQEAEVF